MAGFLGSISSKIRVMKEMERRKRKSAEGERRRSEKKKKVALLVFIVASLEKKNCWLQKVHKVFKNPSRSIDHYVYTTVIAQTQYSCFQ